MTPRLKSCLLALLVAVVLGAAVGVPFAWYVISLSQDAAKRVTCSGQLCGLSLAMRQYYESHGHFPPAYVLGPDGKPWHSWRVLILPHLPDEAPDLFKEYNFSEPWDGPNNRKLHSRMPRYYACPSDPDGLAAGRTNRFVVVGPSTAFPGPKPTTLADVTRTHNQTILLVEAAGQDINWLEPRDLSFADMNFETDDHKSPTISSKHRFPNLVLVDGSQRTLRDLTPRELRTMLLIRPGSD